MVWYSNHCRTAAGVVELVDTGDLKSPGSDTVPVRVRSPAPSSYRGVEQLVARRAHNPEVAGSSPVSATRKRQLSIWTAVFLIIQRKLHRKHTPLRQRVTCRTPPAPGACAPSPARRRDSAAHSFRRKYTRRRDVPARHSVPAPSPAVFPVLWPN